jgi:hypothetical protein
MLERLQTTFNLAELPAVAETIEANNLSWNLYEFTHQQGNLTMFGALALTQNDERTYFVLMQTVEVFYENLHETLFLPVVQSISPIQRYQDPEELFSFPIPPTWTLETADGYALLRNPDDSIRLIVSAAESDDAAAAMTALWQQYNPDFALTYAEENMRVVDDPAQLFGLDRVTIIDWLDTAPDSTVLRQGVAREFDGVQYIILIEGEGAAIERENAAYSMVDSGLQIEALMRAIEATEDAASS